MSEFSPRGGTRTPDQEADDPGGGGTRLVPMKIGDAEVYIEAVGPSATIETDGEFRAAGGDFRPVGGLNPAEAFEKASDALRECIRIVGERTSDLRGALAPDEIGVEFTITFDIEGKASIVPVLLTGKAKTAMGVKVNAVWKPGANGAAKKPAQAGGE